MIIEKWLEEFNNNWSNHNIDDVLRLFAEDVEYWETPFYKLDSIDHIRNEWQAILLQKDIQLKTRVYDSDSRDRYTIIWNLRYKRDGFVHELAGTYLIELNDKGLCNYFYCMSEHK